jgi:hypothetical protein
MPYMKQAAEWQAIRDELIDAWENRFKNGIKPIGREPTAFQVTLEQKKRMLARGEKFMEYEDIMTEYHENGDAFIPLES